MKLRDFFPNFKRNLGKLALLLTTGTLIGLYNAETPITPEYCMAKPAKKEAVLLVDDNYKTRNLVESYLKERGYEKIIQATNLDEAKTAIKTNSNLTRIITDLDLTGSFDKESFPERNFLHRTDGYSLLDWLNTQQKTYGNYKNITKVTLHSTTLNSNCLDAFIAKPVAMYIAYRIKEMGGNGIIYRAQPKNIILND